jgi:hypothetical protein
MSPRSVAELVDLANAGGAAEYLHFWAAARLRTARPEASPTDRIWGIGLAADDRRAADPTAWRGLGLLGSALMEAREQLRNLR